MSFQMQAEFLSRKCHCAVVIRYGNKSEPSEGELARKKCHSLKLFISLLRQHDYTCVWSSKPAQGIWALIGIPIGLSAERLRNQNSAPSSCGGTAVLRGLLTGSGARTVQMVSEIVYPSLQQWKRKGDPSPPPRTNVKNAWIFTSNYSQNFRVRYLSTFCVHLWRSTSFTNKISFNVNGLSPCLYTAN